MDTDRTKLKRTSEEGTRHALRHAPHMHAESSMDASALQTEEDSKAAMVSSQVG